MEERTPESGSSRVNDEDPNQAWFLYTEGLLVQYSVAPTEELCRQLLDLHHQSPVFVRSVYNYVVAQLEQELDLERVTARPRHLRPETWREADDPSAHLERRIAVLKELL